MRRAGEVGFEKGLNTMGQIIAEYQWWNRLTPEERGVVREFLAADAATWRRKFPIHITFSGTIIATWPRHGRKGKPSWRRFARRNSLS